MAGLAAIEEIRALLIEAGADSPERDFEVAYAAIRADDSMREIADQVDLAVRKYFSDIEIVDRPTIYDHLLLGLRGKDLIATFNWDPLIIQAYRRLARLGSTNLPHLVFLHGNVALGTCRDDNETGVLYARCRVCGNHLEPVPLLYPVTEKNYEADDFIAGSWAALRQELERAALVTVFGYRAPDSDVAAMTEFKRAWGTADRRQFEQFELIGRPGGRPRGAPRPPGRTSFTRTIMMQSTTSLTPGLHYTHAARERPTSANSLRRSSSNLTPCRGTMRT